MLNAKKCLKNLNKTAEMAKPLHFPSFSLPNIQNSWPTGILNGMREWIQLSNRYSSIILMFSIHLEVVMRGEWEFMSETENQQNQIGKKSPPQLLISGSVMFRQFVHVHRKWAFEIDNEEFIEITNYSEIGSLGRMVSVFSVYSIASRALYSVILSSLEIKNEEKKLRT